MLFLFCLFNLVRTSIMYSKIDSSFEISFVFLWNVFEINILYSLALELTYADLFLCFMNIWSSDMIIL